MNETEAELKQAALEIGRSRGWGHANYVDAYGGDLHAAPEVPERFEGIDTYYIAAYEEGIDYHESGLDADGEPRDD